MSRVAGLKQITAGFPQARTIAELNGAEMICREGNGREGG